MLHTINPFLVAGMLFFLSLVAGALSEKIKVPALILFLGIGMFAGVDGPGGLDFSDANAANQVGTFALAFITIIIGLIIYFICFRRKVRRNTYQDHGS